MRLLDLFTELGTTVEEVAVAVGVSPLLIRRIDAGEQPMPFALRRVIASVIGVSDERVAEACLFSIESIDRIILNAIPPRLGEFVPPARIASTQPVSPSGGSPPAPGDTRRLVIFFNASGTSDEYSIVEEWAVSSDGSATIIGAVSDLNGEYASARSGIFVPPDAPTSLLAADQDDGSVLDLNPDTFALDASYVDANQITSQLLAWDPVGLFPWYASQADEALIRLDPDGTFSVAAASVATTAGAPSALCFMDGSLFALCAADAGGGDTNWKVVKVNPTPGGEALSLVSTAFLASGSNLIGGSICTATTVPDALFTPGDPGFIIEWDVVVGDTPSITPNPIALGGLTVTGTVFGLIYDEATDHFWGISESSFFRCNTAGFVDFVEDNGTMNPAMLPALIPSFGMVVTIGTTGQKTLRTYNANPPVLLAAMPVGDGPNPMGQNLQPLSFALRPAP